MSDPDRLGRVVLREGVVVVRRERGRSRYHAHHAVTGEALTSPSGQGSIDQAVTQAETTLRRAQRRSRRCLRCGRAFLSDGPGHRLCSERCRDADALGPEPMNLRLPRR